MGSTSRITFQVGGRRVEVVRVAEITPSGGAVEVLEPPLPVGGRGVCGAVWRGELAQEAPVLECEVL
jgi:hypothetical protein